jgi:hypothetical protein
VTATGATSRSAGAIAVALSALIALGSIVLLALGPGRSLPADVFGGVGGASFLLLSLSLVAVGWIVTSRLPGNRIGWIFCALGLLIGATVLAWVYADYGLYAVSTRLPGAGAAAAFPGEPVAALLGFAVLLFPDGRLPSRRWQPVAYMLGLASVLLLVTDVLRPGRLDDPFAIVSNPFGISGTRAAMDAVNLGAWLLVAVGLALASGSLLIRLRRARGTERQQLKLVLAVGAIVGLVTALVMSTWLIWPHGNLQLRMGVLGVSFAAFPMAAGVAILRYRLYDIDVVINRTLVYSALTATLAAAYLGSVLLLQLVLSGVAGGSGLAVAASTLVAAALFRPARARIQHAVDRHFYRGKYDAQRTLEGFSARLRNEVDLAALKGELRAVVRETLQPAHVTLWLRERT